MILNKVIDQETKEVRWEGSGRGYGKSDLRDFREYLIDAGFANWAFGHANAFGISFDDAKFGEFMRYANEDLSKLNFEPSYGVDFIFNANESCGTSVLRVTELEPYWGQNISEAMIAIEGVKVTKDNLVLMSPDKSPTIKITLQDGTCLIKFKSSHEEYESLLTDSGCIVINAVGKCKKNIWNGRITPQILLEDYEIINRQEYYF